MDKQRQAERRRLKAEIARDEKIRDDGRLQEEARYAAIIRISIAEKQLELLGND